MAPLVAAIIALLLASISWSVDFGKRIAEMMALNAFVSSSTNWIN